MKSRSLVLLLCIEFSGAALYRCTACFKPLERLT